MVNWKLFLATPVGQGGWRNWPILPFPEKYWSTWKLWSLPCCCLWCQLAWLTLSLPGASPWLARLGTVRQGLKHILGNLHLTHNVIVTLLSRTVSEYETALHWQDLWRNWPLVLDTEVLLIFLLGQQIIFIYTGFIKTTSWAQFCPSDILDKSIQILQWFSSNYSRTVKSCCLLCLCVCIRIFFGSLCRSVVYLISAAYHTYKERDDNAVWPPDFSFCLR